ncbi:MAG TPA: glycoside hydrolase family 9 protein, partial [Opitutaceae bacterium]
NTTIDQANHRVEIHSPDGKPDVLQQIEHGALTIVGGYKSLGRLYRGIQTATLRQYVLLGDAADMTDNKVYDQSKYKNTQPPAVGLPGSPDDNWVFTEDNPRRELMVASHLAASYRALKDLNPELANDCLHIAEELWDKTKEKNPGERISAAVELLITTNDQKYADFLKQHVDIIGEHFRYLGWVAARTLKLIDDQHYHQVFETAAKAYRAKIDELGKKTPYGVPYEPAIWGAGWTIQRFGVEQYFLHDALPDIFPDTYMLHALDFILGFHPGSNTSTFVSGVGAKSLIPGYGNNRADWSYIPGGIGSGTALIRPDFPELMDWPFFWQQREYVLGEGTSDYIFLVLAAQHELKK